jgi:YfiH family protein
MSGVLVKFPHAFSTKANGSMKKEDGTLDFSNIEQFLKINNLSTNFVCMSQVHGGDVSLVTGGEKQVANVDGLITNTKNTSLVVVTADCLPILFYDPKKEAIAVAHAGSKGLLNQIIGNTVIALKQNFNIDPKDLSVVIGPGIERDCYEVGIDLLEKFEKQFHWFDSSFTKPSKQNHAFLDLRKTALHCLLKEGILKEQIQISDECTKCSVDSYYSYRRGDKNGRFVSVISLI